MFQAKSGKELMGFLLNDFLMLTKPSKSLIGKQFSFDKNMGVSFKLYRKVNCELYTLAIFSINLWSSSTYDTLCLFSL